jgi:DNA-binding CsgD family transcriptional regulator
MTKPAAKRSATSKPRKISSPVASRLHDGKPVVHKAVRIEAAALDAVMAEMKLTDANKIRVRAVLVNGLSMREVARSDDVSPELVSATVRRVRAKLHGNLPPWSFVTVSLTLPLVLAEELRGFTDELATMNDVELRLKVLKNVQKAIAQAKLNILDSDD